MLVDIEGLLEDQVVVFPEQQRAAFHVHERTDHVQGLFDDLVEIEGGRSENAADLLDEIHFPLPLGYGRPQALRDNGERNERRQHIDLSFSGNDAGGRFAPQQQHPVDVPAHFERRQDGGFGRGGDQDFQPRQLAGGGEIGQDDGVALLQRLVDQGPLVGVGVPLVKGNMYFRPVFQDGKSRRRFVFLGKDDGDIKRDDVVDRIEQ